MKMRRLCAYIMALLLAASMPLTAVAEDWYLENGDISVNASESGQTVSQGTQSNIPDSAPVITQSGGSTSNSVTINANAGSTANVTLKDVNIDTSTTGGAAVEIKGGGNVTIELDSNNTVQSSDGHAGIEKNNSGNLTITDDNETAGSLEATGGINGAGIGGAQGGNGSNITISGGNVTANGGEGGAGIGGGDAKGSGSNITISDGTVTANGGTNGAGIGGGYRGDGSGITISGGTVNANGGTDAAGIGGGYDGDGSNITISGGTTTAIGGDAPLNDDGTKGQGGGAGIGGGAYGEGNNITVKFNAQVTAKGKGNAANIGNGYASEATEKQKDKVDLSGLSSFGKVNGVPGSDGGFHASNGSSGSSGGSFVSFFGTNSGSNSSSSPSYKSRLDVKATLGKITSTDNDGNDLSTVVWLKADSELDITAKEDKFSVTGSLSDLLKLKEEGISKINLETKRVNVSVSNQVLDKITDSGGGFQLTADGTTVSLSSTDGNNQKTPGLKLTADKQPEKGKLQVDFLSEESKEGAGDVRESRNKTLQVSTNAPEATLSYNRKFLNALMNSEFGKLALAVGNLLATMENQLAAITAQNGSGSISIDDNSVIMYDLEFSAADSFGNDKLSDMVNSILLQIDKQAQGGSVLVTEVDAKAAMASASLKVPGSALQSLMDQGVAETALSVNGETTSFKNSNLLKQIQDSRLGSTATVTDKHIANDESKTWSEKVDKDGNVIISADDLL